MAIAKRVPYGVSNFKKIIKFNQYYVDKTMYWRCYQHCTLKDDISYLLPT